MTESLRNVKQNGATLSSCTNQTRELISNKQFCRELRQHQCNPCRVSYFPISAQISLMPNSSRLKLNNNERFQSRILSRWFYFSSSLRSC
ncbi:hypothetical protein SUGI_0579200 [Cryptomeria japonica]|nr:hypothetical protein SUGI_0579200 [Cryptomeria japonica]